MSLTTTPLSTLLKPVKDNSYFAPSFRTVLEKHMPLIRTHRENTIIPVRDNLAAQWRGDFYGLLSALDFVIDREMYWVIMRVNNIDHPAAFDGALDSLMIPHLSYLEKIATSHKLTNGLRG